MKQVMLVCNAGMSTGIMAKRIEEAAGGALKVVAYGEAEYETHLDGIDLILVGPQIRYLVPNIQQKASCPVEFIPPQMYGAMDGKRVFALIMDKIGGDTVE